MPAIHVYERISTHFERISTEVLVIVGRTGLPGRLIAQILLDGSPNTIISRAGDSMFVSVVVNANLYQGRTT